jgi:uncharacterized protein YggE
MAVLNPFLSRVVDAGVDEVRSVNFELLDPLAVRIWAREEAATAARRKAEAILKGLGATLGRVHSAVDVPVPNNVIAYRGASPFNTYVEDDLAKNSLGLGESTIAVGQIEERASIEVTFEIGQ